MIATDIAIYIDTVCVRNPGNGGFAVGLHRYQNKVEISRSYSWEFIEHTSNFLADLRAAIAAFEQIELNETAKITFLSDNKTLISAMDEWVPRWKRSPWRKGNGKPVEHQCYWKQLADAAERLDVVWEWIPKHSVDPNMEDIEDLAVRAAYNLI